MTFDLSPDEQSLRAAARAFADAHVKPAAGVIDEQGRIPDSLKDSLRDARLAGTADHTARRAAIVVEELATASPAVAASVGLRGASVAVTDLPGLRGLDIGQGTPDTADRIALAAVAVGAGRAAIDEALAVLKAAGERPSGGAEERPHWVLADAATEIDAARLLAFKAANAADAGAAAEVGAATAQVFAIAAAGRAVDAALRVIGASSYRRGSVLERLSRDVRAAQMILGTEDEGRAIAAGSLPH